MVIEHRAFVYTKTKNFFIADNLKVSQRTHRRLCCSFLLFFTCVIAAIINAELTKYEYSLIAVLILILVATRRCSSFRH